MGAMTGDRQDVRGRARWRVLLVTTAGAVALGTSSAHAAGPVNKYFNCYQTTSSTSDPVYSGSSPDPTYTSVFKLSLVLKRSGPVWYQVQMGGASLNTFSDHVGWNYLHHKLSFHRGYFDNAPSFGWRVLGRYYPHGVQMPHSQLTPAKYTLVLRSKGEPATDSAPPRVEGSDFRQSSFFYCTTGKPVHNGG